MRAGKLLGHQMDIAPQKLRRARETAFLTQVELGHEADVTEMTISRLGLGLGRARFRTVRKLAAALERVMDLWTPGVAVCEA